MAAPLTGRIEYDDLAAFTRAVLDMSTTSPWMRMCAGEHGRTQRVWTERANGRVFARSIVTSHCTPTSLMSTQDGLPAGVVARRGPGGELLVQVEVGTSWGPARVSEHLSWFAQVADRLDWSLNGGADAH